MPFYGNPDRYKNTDSGAMYISTYTGASTGTFTVGTTYANRHQPQEVGATGARFALIQVLTDSANVSVAVGSSGGSIGATAALMRIGRTYGMPYLQIPTNSDTELIVTGDPLGSAPVSYTIIWVN